VSDTTFGFGFEGALETACPADEQALIAALRAGSEDAYEALILRYQQAVFNLAYRLVNDPVDTCDVVQEVFLKIFRNIGHFRGGSSLRTWIYRVAVNEAHNHRRWFSRHQGPEIGFVAEETAGPHECDFADPARSPFEQAANEETRELVEAALATLNPKYRAAVVLRDIEELSYEEIAAVLEVSMGTVKSRILRGRDALRRILEGQLETEPAFGLRPQPVE